MDPSNGDEKIDPKLSGNACDYLFGLILMLKVYFHCPHFVSRSAEGTTPAGAEERSTLSNFLASSLR
jgi:hypothetical protein